MHNAFLTVNQQKMSKSLGNFFTVREILEHFPGEVIRFYLLGTHYRSPLDFDDENLRMAQKSLERLQTSIRLADEALGRQGQSSVDAAADQKLLDAALEARREFEAAMDDDFNSALAYASLFELGKTINAHVQAYPYTSEGLQKARATLWELANVLGFDLANPAGKAEANNEMLEQVMELLLEVRGMARKKKDWEMSDLIRDRLKDMGIVLEDTPQGARWTIKS